MGGQDLILQIQGAHIRGTQNVVADALSRMFSQPSEAQPEQPCSVLLDFPLAFTDVLPLSLIHI